MKTNEANGVKIDPDADKTITLLTKDGACTINVSGIELMPEKVEVKAEGYVVDQVTVTGKNGKILPVAQNADGMDNNSFAPNAGCTRTQIVTFLYRDMVK